VSQNQNVWYQSALRAISDALHAIPSTALAFNKVSVAVESKFRKLSLDTATPNQKPSGAFSTQTQESDPGMFKDRVCDVCAFLMAVNNHRSNMLRSTFFNQMKLSVS
jgi:hypothetical protein